MDVLHGVFLLQRYDFFLFRSFFCCDKKTNQKKRFAKNMPPLRSGIFRDNVFVAFTPHIQ